MERLKVMLMEHSKPKEVASLRDGGTVQRHEVSALYKSTNGNPKICFHKGNASPSHSSSSNKVNVTDAQVFGKSICQNIDNSGRSIKRGLTDRKFNHLYFGILESSAHIAYHNRLKSDYDAIFRVIQLHVYRWWNGELQQLVRDGVGY